MQGMTEHLPTAALAAAIASALLTASAAALPAPAPTAPLIAKRPEAGGAVARGAATSRISAYVACSPRGGPARACFADAAFGVIAGFGRAVRGSQCWNIAGTVEGTPERCVPFTGRRRRRAVIPLDLTALPNGWTGRINVRWAVGRRTVAAWQLHVRQPDCTLRVPCPAPPPLAGPSVSLGRGKSGDDVVGAPG